MRGRAARLGIEALPASTLESGSLPVIKARDVTFMPNNAPNGMCTPLGWTSGRRACVELERAAPAGEPKQRGPGEERGGGRGGRGHGDRVLPHEVVGGRGRRVGWCGRRRRARRVGVGVGGALGGEEGERVARRQRRDALAVIVHGGEEGGVVRVDGGGGFAADAGCGRHERWSQAAARQRASSGFHLLLQRGL
ncbi:hypothetical protein FB451DRAFT_1469900 [Mycena latifolia]|nr:hypothetical protein FB451DRAFT_1469900 [Mycena latifolia]